MTLIRIDNQNDIRPFIGRKGELVYSEQRGSLFIKTKSGIVEIGSGSSTPETDPIFNAWLTTPPNVSTFVNDAGYLTSETDPVYSASSWFSTTNNSTDWDTAYSWGNHASAGYVPQTRTLTINGTTYDLSTDRSWTIPTSSLPTFTSGSVLFSDGSTISQDNTNFFWDNSNKRLHIGGVQATTAKLSVVNPSGVGDLLFLGVSTDTNAIGKLSTLTTSVNRRVAMTFANPNTEWAVGFNTSDGKFRIAQGGDLGTDASTALFIDTTTYNVGIKVPSPQVRLHVANSGSANASGQAVFQINASHNTGTIGSGAKIIFGDSDNTHAASIRSYTFGSANTGLAFNTGYAGLSSDKMFIDGNGYVGIGTVPSVALHVKRPGGNSTNLRLESAYNNTASVWLDSAGSNWFIANQGSFHNGNLLINYGGNPATSALEISKTSQFGFKGVTSPSAIIHIGAGTASTGTAPLKFTNQANLLTTPENGAFEFDGTNLYFTIGGVRKIVNLT